MVDLSRLDDVCMDIAEVFQEICQGRIDLMDNRNVRAVGPGFVASQIGKAVNSVGFKAMARSEVSLEEVEGLADDLESIANAFEVEELVPHIKELRSMIEKEKMNCGT